MEPNYRNEAARIFYIVSKGTELQIHGPPSLLQLSYSLEQGLEASIRAKHNLVTAKQRQEISANLNRRLQSRTNGLVEIVSKDG
jgi:hypothetical protein